MVFKKHPNLSYFFEEFATKVAEIHLLTLQKHEPTPEEVRMKEKRLKQLARAAEKRARNGGFLPPP